MMSTPALNFVAVCGNANLPLKGTKATHLKALKDSGAALGSSQTPADLKERFCALTWVRHAVANATPYVSSMMLLHIRMLSFIFRSPVAERTMRSARRKGIERSGSTSGPRRSAASARKTG